MMASVDLEEASQFSAASVVRKWNLYGSSDSWHDLDGLGSLSLDGGGSLASLDGGGMGGFERQLDASDQVELPFGSMASSSIMSSLDLPCEPVKLMLPDMVCNPHYLPLPRKGFKHQDMEREERRLQFICSRDSALAAKSKRCQLFGLPQTRLRNKEMEIEARLMDRLRSNPRLRRAFLLQQQEMVRGHRHEEERLKEADRDRLRRMRSPSPNVNRNLGTSGTGEAGQPSFPSPSPPTTSGGPEASGAQAQRRLTLAQNASHRRSTLTASRQLRAAEVQEKSARRQERAQRKQRFSRLQIAHQRRRAWAKIAAVLGLLRVVCDVVAQAREARYRSPRLWTACLRVQRWWRRLLFYRKHRSVKKGKGRKIMARLRRSSYSSNVDRYRQRQWAADLVTRYLNASLQNPSVKLRAYLARVRLLQRLVRRHLHSNAARVDLLHRLLLRLLPLLLQHVEVVLAGRGEDLQNLTSADLQGLGALAHSARPYAASLVDRLCLSLPFFHSHVRLLEEQLRAVRRLFLTHMASPHPSTSPSDTNSTNTNSNVKSASPYAYAYTGSLSPQGSSAHKSTTEVEGGDAQVYSGAEAEARAVWGTRAGALMRRELLDLLFRTRRLAVQDLKTSQRAPLHIPPIQTSEARAFMRGGPDPLSDHLRAADVLEQFQRRQFEQRLWAFQQAGRETDTDAGVGARPVGSLHSSEELALLLLQAVSADDLMGCLMHVGVQADALRAGDTVILLQGSPSEPSGPSGSGRFTPRGSAKVSKAALAQAVSGAYGSSKKSRAPPEAPISISLAGLRRPSVCKNFETSSKVAWRRSSVSPDGASGENSSRGDEQQQGQGSGAGRKGPPPGAPALSTTPRTPTRTTSTGTPTPSPRPSPSKPSPLSPRAAKHKMVPASASASASASAYATAALPSSAPPGKR
ncbi:hypothetical protein B484DRAFT_70082 [Ochromonadaceae sp. CCMP2298]|nr:hypothetical protein B484DRAFT_70082 [Ochromonadaceae sp. CCMP2298]